MVRLDLPSTDMPLVTSPCSWGSGFRRQSLITSSIRGSLQYACLPRTRTAWPTYLIFVALSAHFIVTLTSLVQLFNARPVAHRLACLFDTCSALCFFMHGAKFGAVLHALLERITTSICLVLLLVALCSTLSGMSIECSASPVSRATSFLQLPRLEDHSTALGSLASFFS